MLDRVVFSRTEDGDQPWGFSDRRKVEVVMISGEIGGREVGWRVVMVALMTAQLK